MNEHPYTESVSEELKLLDQLHASVWPQAVGGSMDHIEMILAIMDRRAAITGLYDPAEIESGFQGNAWYLEELIDDLPP